MHPLRTLLACCLALVALGASAAERATVEVSHSYAGARPSETITIPWTEINRVLPGALLQKLAVKDARGNVLPYQVTNVAPQAKDPQGVGIAYGELIFQYSFAAGEQSATFTIEKTESVAPVFATKAFGRYIQERLDDFAWENDRIAHRTYGPALAAPDDAKVGKEVLVTSGIDVWCKRVSYPIVDRWYNKGHDHYHVDQGEGMDMYQVGGSRGCGGTGVWNGSALAVSRNYQSWKILANGPVRVVFELTYAPWEAHGVKVAETKRFTLDAGHQLNRIETTFTVVEGDARELTIAVGLNKNPADRGQEPVIALTPQAGQGSFTQWIKQKSNGELGTAVIIPGGALQGFAEDDRNHLLLAKVTPGQPLRYYAGAGWSRAGEFTSEESWNRYIADLAARINAPLTVRVSR